MAGNSNLHDSARNKQDEFYTQLSLIENELRHYKTFFKGKTVLCNCDDPFESNFFKFFAMNFNALGLKKLIATCYATSSILYTQLDLFGNEKVVSKKYGKKKPYKVIITEVRDENGDGRVDLADVEYLLKNKKNVLTLLKSDGDFRSPECVKLLKQSDVVVTNPPFSLFREYLAQLEQYEKQYIIIGNMNAVTYKEIFPLIAQNRLWLGYNSGHFWFKVPDNYEEKKTDFKIDETGQKWRRMGNICWFTNIDIQKRHENLILFRKYSPEVYPKYDNYDAINVDKTVDIPCDYDGVMGVPITFLDKYNPDQFEIVAFRKGPDGKDLVYSFTSKTQSDRLILEQSRAEQSRAEQSRVTYSAAIFPDTHSQNTDIPQLTGNGHMSTDNENMQGYSFATAIPGMIKNAEGKIKGKITYVRLTIRKRRGK